MRTCREVWASGEVALSIARQKMLTAWKRRTNISHNEAWVLPLNEGRWMWSSYVPLQEWKRERSPRRETPLKWCCHGWLRHCCPSTPEKMRRKLVITMYLDVCSWEPYVCGVGKPWENLCCVSCYFAVILKLLFLKKSVNSDPKKLQEKTCQALTELGVVLLCQCCETAG